MKRHLFFSALSLIAGLSFGQSYEQTANGIKATAGGQQLEMQFYSPSIARVFKYPMGERPEKKSYAVVKTPEQGLTVTVKPMRHNLLIVQSDSLSVVVNTRTGRIKFADARGKILLAEKDWGTQFTPVEYGDNKTMQVRQAFRLDEDEAIYGLGQHQAGKMNQRNQTLTLRQVNTDIAIPYIHSTKGYGLLWDNSSPTTFTDNPAETAFDSQAGRCADYYFIYGATADQVVGGMRDLTGQVQMNPMWTYGYWQSRERYTGQEELLDVVRRYRTLQVPLDGIVQDWQYWGVDNNMWNAVEFGNPNFPDPKKMIDEAHRMNAHMSISVWPSFGKATAIHKQMKDEGLLLDFNTYPSEANVYDVFNPRAREIYWQQMDRNIFSLGMDSWWLDATEPEFSDKDEKLNQPTHAGQYREVYNAFTIVSVGSVYDHQRAASQDKRVYILTRSAFAGQQRYGACSWSGDIAASWDVLRKQISAGLNFSICGIPYWNTDIGGFVTWNTYREGVKDPAYRELYARWIQFGTFCPMMRSHGTNTPREIWQFGERGSWEFDNIERYIHLRYRLMPYLYSTAWDVSHNAGTFMRGLFMDFPHDHKVKNLGHEYMFGRAMLVAPVTEAMYVDEDKHVDMSYTGSCEVYLPQGTGWTDFRTGTRHRGGQTVTRETPIDIIPLYIRDGSILPMGPRVQYTGEKAWDNLEIRVYTGADGTFTLYEDEGDNYNYEKGQYSEIPLLLGQCPSYPHHRGKAGSL